MQFALTYFSASMSFRIETSSLLGNIYGTYIHAYINIFNHNSNSLPINYNTTITFSLAIKYRETILSEFSYYPFCTNKQKGRKCISMQKKSIQIRLPPVRNINFNELALYVHRSYCIAWLIVKFSDKNNRTTTAALNKTMIWEKKRNAVVEKRATCMTSSPDVI